MTLADKLQSNSTDVYTFLSINDFHSPMSVDRKHISSLQKPSLHTVPSALAQRHVYWQKSERSRGGNVKFGLVMP
jgi:hypothetical protein